MGGAVLLTALVGLSLAQDQPGGQQPPSPATPSGTIDPEKPATPFPPTIVLERKDKKITAIKYGPDEKGLVVDCLPPDDAKGKDRVTRSVYVDESPYLVHVTVEKNLIRAPVVVARKREGGDGELEAYNGTATPADANSNDCLPKVKPDPKPGTVLVTQGKTRMTGSRLDYTDETGLAIVQGPIEFERPQEKDTLKGTSQKLTSDVDNEKTFLEGNVVLNSKCRTSKADRVEYDDTINLAILYGKPAVSVQLDKSGKQIGEIKGDVLEYNLDTNDVIVTAVDGKVVGKFDDGSGCDDESPSSSPPSPQPNPRPNPNPPAAPR